MESFLEVWTASGTLVWGELPDGFVGTHSKFLHHLTSFNFPCWWIEILVLRTWNMNFNLFLFHEHFTRGGRFKTKEDIFVTEVPFSPFDLHYNFCYWYMLSLWSSFSGLTNIFWTKKHFPIINVWVGLPITKTTITVSPEMFGLLSIFCWLQLNSSTHIISLPLVFIVIYNFILSLWFSLFCLFWCLWFHFLD